VIAIMMNLLQQTFSQKAIQRKAYERAENYTLFIIAQHAYKLLKQILKKNPTNRMAMSKYVNYFQKRVHHHFCRVCVCVSHHAGADVWDVAWPDDVPSLHGHVDGAVPRQLQSAEEHRRRPGAVLHLPSP
jgi:hypothetical protein